MGALCTVATFLWIGIILKQAIKMNNIAEKNGEATLRKSWRLPASYVAGDGKMGIS